VPDEVWARTQLLYVCSPGNPTGAVLTLDDWRELFALSDRHGFVIASDECYSEIYFDEAAPPLGGLEAAHRLGRGFERLVMLSSLSKRSNVPGMRSGFVAGDAALLKKFLLYRTYHGAALSPVWQHASIAAWNDEAHVRDNRALYLQKFATVTPMLADVLDVKLPDAAFYLWANVARTGLSDTEFARRLYADYNVTVLPGSYLARDAHGTNPGRDFIRIALVAAPRMRRGRATHRRVLPRSRAVTRPSRSIPFISCENEHVATTSANHRYRLGKPRRAVAEGRARRRARSRRHVIEQLDKGALRVAEKIDGNWTVNSG
jgi:N-succinyldiaminopimelate aminotransferase